MAILAKIVLLGDPAVGKTSLRDTFIGRSFETNYLPTLGADYLAKNVMVDGKEVRLQIWDLAGQKSFEEVRKLYYRNSAGALLIFDLTAPKTLDNLLLWCKEFLTYSKSKHLTIIVIGNKSDLMDKDYITKEAIDIAIAKIKTLDNRIETKIHFIKTSALTGENVGLAFNKLAKSIVLRLKNRDSYNETGSLI